MTLLCVTNDMDDWRSCTIRDAHTVRCGNPGTCTGCLPRLAQVGLLCYPCWDRVEHAFADWTAERAHLMGSIDRAVQRDTGGRTCGPEGYVPIPGTRLAVDEVESYLRSSNGFQAAEAWVSTVAGAADAVRFAAAAHRALRTHELEERARPLRRTRCPECGQLSFVRNPPATAGAPVTVVCQNETCRTVIREGDRTPKKFGDEEKLAIIARIEKTRPKERSA
ncbi:hypothetical protein O159_22870 [Leifsonia xyli subsp. cynodontis DSM 46306]|jgi:hypothetical protein|uniref:Uncharacterized protein n=1 Tax=Leifsonia xyli subsp. cynodontis DSM 46306 TaxID=1389489 RepID=U3PA61_LEIXC|nr:hypothetical protein [Leifsonia xyli]AGW41727.1 hypothetical protein O159_16820 [Leifsonia xyli subsp. cynodontis DSM 46306]AGW42250.1 hypothetical protein O159_22870 [Leifsonia xyli subsp. cynodontis DSM 46306]